MSAIGFTNHSLPAGNQFELNLHYCGKQDCIPGHSWGPGIRDHYKITYIHHGKGTMKVGDRTYRLHGQQGFVIFPNTIYSYKADEDEPWTYSWIAFKGMQAESYFKLCGLSVQQPVFDTGGNPWFESFFDELMDARDTPKSQEFRFRSILYRLLAELTDAAEENSFAGKMSSPKVAYVRKAIDYIEMNFSQKVNIATLADVVGVDRKYLSVLFKEFAGMSPQAFLVQFRMKKAAELMHHPHLTISDISRSVGYHDPLLFSKMFKKMTGTAPRAYREALQ